MWAVGAGIILLAFTALAVVIWAMDPRRGHVAALIRTFMQIRRLPVAVDRNRHPTVKGEPDAPRQT